MPTKTQWRMPKQCKDCPFAESGPGAFLRETLRDGRMQEIEQDLLQGKHFMCHKTTKETGNGKELLCAGAIEWAEARGVTSQYQRVCERVDAIFDRRKHGQKMDSETQERVG